MHLISPFTLTTLTNKRVHDREEAAKMGKEKDDCIARCLYHVGNGRLRRLWEVIGYWCVPSYVRDSSMCVRRLVCFTSHLLAADARTNKVDELSECSIVSVHDCAATMNDDNDNKSRGNGYSARNFFLFTVDSLFLVLFPSANLKHISTFPRALLACCSYLTLPFSEHPQHHSCRRSS